jgi:large subunit ribosomal protein L16
MLSPKRTKYRKPHRGSLGGKNLCGNSVSFGEYGIQSIQSSWITSRQIESGRRVLVRYIRRGGKLWIRIFPDKIITRRPQETRIGSGKGRIRYWVAVVSQGTIIFELNGIPINIARQAIRIAASKLPIKTKFVLKFLSEVFTYKSIIMIQPQTYVKAVDNTGARQLICIRVLGGCQARLGEIIVAVVKESLPNITIKRSEVVIAVVVRICRTTQRINGSQIRFDDNAVVVINKDGNPRGSRVFGPVARELRDKNFTKIVSLAPEVILSYLLFVTSNLTLTYSIIFIIFMVQDTLCDTFTRIRNAVYVKSSTVEIPKTCMTESLRKIFYQEGFIDEVSESMKSSAHFKQKVLIFRLKYKGIQRIPVIIKLQRISRPGLRIYVKHKEIPKVLNKLGLTILSTSQGLMTNHEAVHYKVGGEVICSIW